MTPAPSAIAVAAICRACRASGDAGSVAPSRTAAIGGTRVARSAGSSPATSVITTPTAMLTTTVRVVSTAPLSGMLSSAAATSAARPLSRPIPSRSPATEPTTPMTADSTATELRTWRRDAPSMRRVASSRMRCAIVIESVLKMTKAPTKSAMPPNASRNFRILASSSSLPFDSAATCA
jgi:hypothetical protein